MRSFLRVGSLVCALAVVSFGQLVVNTGGGTASGGGGGATIASTSEMIKGDGAGNGVAAIPGTDFSKPATNETTSGNRTITGALDASGATTTKPNKSGTALPGTCSVGETFLDTDATAGQNIYGCTATNTWTLQGDGNTGGSSSVSTTAFEVTRISGSVLHVGANCSTSAPCVYMVNGTATRVTTTPAATITWASGTSGNVRVWIDSAGIKAAGETGLTVTCSGCTASTGISDFPTPTSSRIPLAIATVSSSAFDVSGVTAYKPDLSINHYSAGANCSIDSNNVITCGSTAVTTNAYFPTAGWPYTAASTAVSSSANNVRAYLVTSTRSMPVARVTFNVTTAGAASSTCAFALYNGADGTEAVRGNPVLVDSTGWKSITSFATSGSLVANQSYYAAGTCTDAAVRVHGITGSSSITQNLLNATPGGLNFVGVATNSATAGVLPTSLGSPAIGTAVSGMDTPQWWIWAN